MIELPPIAQEIADLVGLDGLYALVRAYGGQRWQIPNNIQDNGVRQLLGFARAEKLGSILGGMVIDMPNLKAHIGRHQVLSLHADGHSVGKIVRATGYTHRRVRQILAEARQAGHGATANERQGDLFAGWTGD